METKKNNGVRFSADVKISEKGIGKDVNIDIRYIDLTNPIEWDQLQRWLIKLRRTLEVTFGNEETLDWYCNSEHEPRRSWDMQSNPFSQTDCSLSQSPLSDNEGQRVRGLTDSGKTACSRYINRLFSGMTERAENGCNASENWITHPLSEDDLRAQR